MTKSRKKHRKSPPKQGKKRQAEHGAVGQDAPAPRARPGGSLQAGQTDEPSKVLTLLPMAPLICRSGRPFDEQAGPDSARLPPPSTVAGCLRTAWAREADKAFGDHLMKVHVEGPILARPISGDELSLYAPRPADALYFGQGDAARCLRAAPKPFTKGCNADLPNGLLPVQLAELPEGKETNGPDWWAWDDLISFRRGDEPTHSRLTKGGWSPTAGDRRTHVAIERSTQAAKTGHLFQTEGLDFAPSGGMADDPSSDLRLLVRAGEPLSAGMAHLGGERRMARLEPRPTGRWPEPPPGWLRLITEAKGVVLTLLTPALFTAGYRPGWLSEQHDDNGSVRWIGSPQTAPNVKLQLRAAALERWRPHSGWDLARQQPRAGRKLVPAGAVYWFSLAGDTSEAELNALWLASICDQEQDRLDGFGLALPAPWHPPTTAPESNTLEGGTTP